MHDLNSPPQVITGRRPFEHINKDDVVVKNVLSGIRPDRPAVGFSDALWGLLTSTWMEDSFKSADFPSARPNTTSILDQLRNEEKSWGPAGGQPTSQMRIEREASGISLTFQNILVRSLHDHHSDEFCRDFHVSGQVCGANGFVSITIFGKNVFSPEFSIDGPEDGSIRDHEVNGNLNNNGCVNGPDSADNDWDFLDPESPTNLSSCLPTPSPSPPRVPPVSPWLKKSGVGKAWSRSRKLFMKKFGRRGAAPKLSDKLVPERDEVKWYEALFSKPQKSPATRSH